MTYYCFKRSLFELADVWCREVSEATYLAFLNSIFGGIVNLSVRSPTGWRTASGRSSFELADAIRLYSQEAGAVFKRLYPNMTVPITGAKGEAYYRLRPIEDVTSMLDEKGHVAAKYRVEVKQRSATGKVDSGLTKAVRKKGTAASGLETVVETAGLDTLIGPDSSPRLGPTPSSPGKKGRKDRMLRNFRGPGDETTPLASWPVGSVMHGGGGGGDDVMRRQLGREHRFSPGRASTASSRLSTRPTPNISRASVAPVVPVNPMVPVPPVHLVHSQRSTHQTCALPEPASSSLAAIQICCKHQVLLLPAVGPAMCVEPGGLQGARHGTARQYPCHLATSLSGGSGNCQCIVCRVCRFDITSKSRGDLPRSPQTDHDRELAYKGPAPRGRGAPRPLSARPADRTVRVRVQGPWEAAARCD